MRDGLSRNQQRPHRVQGAAVNRSVASSALVSPLTRLTTEPSRSHLPVTEFPTGPAADHSFLPSPGDSSQISMPFVPAEVASHSTLDATSPSAAVQRSMTPGVIVSIPLSDMMGFPSDAIWGAPASAGEGPSGVHAISETRMVDNTIKRRGCICMLFVGGVIDAGGPKIL